MSFSLAQLVLVTGLAIVIATGLGFAAGLVYGRGEFRRSMARAQKHLGTLVDAVLASMEQSERLCRSLERFPGGTLSTDQSAKIDRRRSRLFSALADAVQRLRPALPPDADADGTTGSSDKSENEAFSIDWVREPVCERTTLPTRTAFEANLANLLDASNRTPTSFAVLLVSIDKLDQLRSRFGPAAADAFVTTAGRMLLHGVRDADLVCRYGVDTFAVLLPDLDAAEAEQVACTARDTIRQHHFHVDPTGPEVLVTTSFGLALCHPGENLPLLLGRAGDALRRSRKRGRNQLHVHDGRVVDRCASA